MTTNGLFDPLGSDIFSWILRLLWVFTFKVIVLMMNYIQISNKEGIDNSIETTVIKSNDVTPIN